MEVTVSGPEPNDPLMDVVGTALETGTVVAAVRNRNVFTFSLDPGDAAAPLSYTFEASAPGFDSATVPRGPFTFTPRGAFERQRHAHRRDGHRSHAQRHRHAGGE